MKKLLVTGILVLGLVGVGSSLSNGIDISGIPSQHSLPESYELAGIPSQHSISILGIPSQH